MRALSRGLPDHGLLPHQVTRDFLSKLTTDALRVPEQYTK